MAAPALDTRGEVWILNRMVPISPSRAPTDPTLDRAFHALADATRRSLLADLGAGPRTVGALAEAYPISLPGVRKHLRVLEDAGLIESVKVGRTRRCRLRPERLAAAEAWLHDRRRLWERRLDRLARHAETKERT